MVCMLSKLVFREWIVFRMLEDNLCKCEFMKDEAPMGKPKITIPSVVSIPLVYVSMHSLRMMLEAIGKKGCGDALFVDVKMMLLSSRMRKPKLFASCVNVLQ